MHFVTTDAHDTRHRPPTLGDAYAALAALEIVSRLQPRRRQWYRLWS